MDDSRCPQAWHAGLHVGALFECRYAAGHRGWHRDEAGSLSWGGTLTGPERAMADELRSEQEASGD